MILFQTVEVKLGLTTRGKWTPEHDVSQGVYIYIYIYIFGKNIIIYIYIYIHNCKSEVFKKLIPLSILCTHT